ncbi:endonuclease/exonuclease/phosphatase family protein [Vibrio maerlii]|uniref:endonuclease/exonuclease/phosphatase family protein n=1 Tax=Vibrio maerlii TaxID=2231648 RepID=UPI000E3DEB00|nr:endonuclease/exonuclease/phosphatase family protein [Vibrio maerlii]
MKKWKTKLAVVALLVGTAACGYHSIFTIPDSPTLVSDGVASLQCKQFDSQMVLDNEGHIELVVWNIYKQQNEGWKEALNDYSQSAQLLVLQESSLTPELQSWIVNHEWHSQQVEAFKAFDTTAGVLTLSNATPLEACAYLQREPWLQLPKSSLYTLYKLSNGQDLAVINIHAVNFTIGTEEYEQQLKQGYEALKAHQGPIIFAGDFNSWSDARVAAMQSSLEKLGLQEVRFTPDNRTEFVTGLPLDHAYIRGLMVETAEAPLSGASDHNPLLISLKLKD